MGPFDLPGHDLLEPFGWTLLGLLALNALLFLLIVVHRQYWLFLARRRDRIGARLAPFVERLTCEGDPQLIGEQLRPVIASLGREERPVAAWLLCDLMRGASEPTRASVQEVLRETGAIELVERGTRRRTPWRRALACEILGTIGAERSVPVLVERLGDRRREVRTAATRALGAIGSTAGAPALTTMFLECTGVPTGVAYDALRALGPGGGETFRRGLESPSPVVRVASCFGIAALAAEGDETAAVERLVGVLAEDRDARVRSAAAKALGVVGGAAPPPALVGAVDDPELRVRREAVGALGSFDAPLSADLAADATLDVDREVALRAAESLLALSSAPRAGQEARAALISASAWSIAYVRTTAELNA